MHKKAYFLSLWAASLFLLTSTLVGQYNARILQYHTRVVFENNTLKTTRTYDIQINDRESSWIAEVEIPWKEGQKLEIHEAVILDPQGRELRKIRKKEILTSSHYDGMSFYTDHFVEEFDLLWNSYPYRIRYSYTTQTKSYIDLAHWIPYVHSRIPVAEASLSVRVPEKKDCRVVCSEELQFTETLDEGFISYYFRAENLKGHKKEVYAPPFRDRVPFARVIPEHFVYGVPGETGSWENFGEWVSDLNRGSLDLIEFEKAKVEELTQDLEDPREKARVLYHYMQDRTRYVNISLDIGGMKSYPAHYVSKNGYGDCKALSTYMQALLKQAGIASYHALVYAGKNPVQIRKDHPGQQFNHVILAVPLKEDTLWLENTSSTNPFNHLGEFTQNRYALLVNGNQSKLVRTPGMTMEDVKEVRHYEYKLTGIGTGKVSLRLETRGDRFDKIRALIYQGSSRETEKAFRSLSGVRDFELKQWVLEESDRDETSLKLHLEGNVKQQLRNIGDRQVISPLKLKLPDFEDPDKRKQAVRIPLPVNQSDSITYSMGRPDSYTFSLPQRQELKSPYGVYLAEASLNEGQVVFRRTFQIHQGEYGMDEYSDFYAFLEQVREAEKKTSIILKSR